MRNILLVSAISLCLLANPAQAQKRAAKRPVTRAKPAPKPDPVRVLVGAIARNSLSVSGDMFAACEASDIKLLAWGLEGVRDKIALEKSEYETQEEFNARRTKLEDALNPDGDIVICQPLDDNEDAPFRYEAEREVFAGSFKAHQNVWRDVKKTGNYASKTRMGVPVTVTSSLQIEYDVDMRATLDASKPKCVKSSYLNYSYEVPAARAEAPLLKVRGYLVFAGKLVSPFISISDSEGSPTLDDPRDVYERSMLIYFAPRLIAVVGPSGMQPWKCAL